MTPLKATRVVLFRNLSGDERAKEPKTPSFALVSRGFFQPQGDNERGHKTFNDTKREEEAREARRAIEIVSCN